MLTLGCNHANFQNSENVMSVNISNPMVFEYIPENL